MASPRAGYLPDMSSLINQTLQFVDAWSALAAESSTWQANGIAVAQSDVDALNIPGLTVADVQAARSTMQAVADYIHTPATAAKLYRLKS
jgi:hypothetical protein